MENETEIAKNAEAIKIVRNEGFTYTDEDKNCYRVLFSDGEKTKLGQNVVVTAAENTLSLLYSDDKGNIYTLVNESDEANKVGTYSDSVYMSGISDDATISAWLLNSDSSYTPVINIGDDRTTLDSYSSGYSGFQVSFSKDQKIAVLSSYYSNTIYLCKDGEIEKVKLPDILSSNTIYTNKGYLSNTVLEDVSSIFVLVATDSNFKSLYNISLDGDKEKILSKVKNVKISNGTAVYIDSEDKLYQASVKDHVLGEEIKIASDVDSFTLSTVGGYVYYMKDVNNSAGNLYSYKLGDESPLKIASDVYHLLSIEYSVKTSTDGKTVYFIKDHEDIPTTYSSYGTLCSRTYSAKGDTENVKIASDVICGTMSSFLDSGNLTDFFTFRKYSSVDNGQPVFDIISWNGKETVKLASDLISIVPEKK